MVLAALSVMLWAMLPAVGQAAPEGDATIATGPFTVQGNQNGVGQAPCPTGTRVVGGGVSQLSGSLTSSYIEQSGPLDETQVAANLANGDVGRSWYAVVRNQNPAQSTYVVTAICSAGSDATIKVAPFAVANSQTGSGQVSCDPGSRLIGGGVTLGSGDSGSEENSSGPLDESGSPNLQNGAAVRTWYANVDNFGGGAPTNTYVATAICSPTSDATLAIDPFTVQSGGQEDGLAACPAGTRAVGGGVTQATGEPLGGVLPSGPLDETNSPANLSVGDVAHSFYAKVASEISTPANFIASAICAPPPAVPPKCHGKQATVFARDGLLGRELTGTPKRDVIVGTAKKDRISGGKGNDLICAGAGKDLVKGGSGKDKLYGEGGKDKLLGQGGKDLLSGGGKNDTCVGGPGRDTEKSC